MSAGNFKALKCRQRPDDGDVQRRQSGTKHPLVALTGDAIENDASDADVAAPIGKTSGKRCYRLALALRIDDQHHRQVEAGGEIAG